jgi:hypothetical protein
VKKLVDFDEMVDWNVLKENSISFKNSKPFRHTFVKGFFKQSFYDKLYETFPKIDDKWFVNNDYRRSARTLYFQDKDEHKNPKPVPTIGSEWNNVKELVNSQEFIKNFSDFTGVKFSNVYESGFFGNTKGDFQLPHVDEEGDYNFKFQIMFYFAKNWQKGDPGGTYLCKENDESSIFFEPYDLDNTFVCFEETPHSWHGTRYITKDVVRQALSVSLQ